jgi:hypothetical protein
MTHDETSQYPQYFLNPIQCPVSCGWCCDYWRDVFPLYPEEITECPNLTSKGCRYQLEDRGEACGCYLCELGMAVCNGEIDIKQAEVICENGLQQSPDRWKDVLSEGSKNDG